MCLWRSEEVRVEPVHSLLLSWESQELNSHGQGLASSAPYPLSHPVIPTFFFFETAYSPLYVYTAFILHQTLELFLHFRYESSCYEHGYTDP